MAAARLVVWGLLWALLCGCAGGAVDIAALAAFDIDPALKQFIGSMYEEFQADKAALRAELAEERRQNMERKEENQLLTGQVVGLQAMLYEFGQLTNKTRVDAQKMTARLDQCETATHPFIQEMKWRRMQEDALCRGSGLAAMFEACCPSGSVAGNGHRILQLIEGCDTLPQTCSASCAPLFIEYFEGCQGIIDDLAPDQRQMLVGFYGGCQEVEQAAAAMLQDARPAMIFHVMVMSEAEAQQEQMFGGGSAPAPPVGPIGPLPPSPSPAGGAEIAQEFRRVCTTANLTVCVPQCNRLTYGFLLSIEIDGRGTVMTCNKMGLLFSWQGQASLGGYIGDDFQAFFSSVVSGAAGTYIIALSADAGINTDAVIHAGQAVMISGDESLAAAPRWGEGGFTMQQFGSLALSYVRLDAQISALAATDGGTLSLARMALPQAAFGTALAGLSGVGSRLALQAVTVLEHPELGALTGTITAGADGEPLALDPPDLVLPGFFVVLSGSCTTAVVGGRSCVGRWPGYMPNEACQIMVGGGSGTLAECPVWDINDTYGNGADHLTLPDGSQHSHADCPAGVALAGGQTLSWASDGQAQGGNGDTRNCQPPICMPMSYAGAGGGWQICFA